MNVTNHLKTNSKYKGKLPTIRICKEKTKSEDYKQGTSIQTKCLIHLEKPQTIIHD
jgi:hypothetical protein